MSFFGKFRKEFLRAFGFDGDEPPREILDVLLGVLGVISSLVIVAFVFETQPSTELRRYAVLALVALAIVFLAAKHRLELFIAILGFICLRALIAVLLYRRIMALVVAVSAGLLALLVLKLARKQA
jgi:hypothetical protein